MKFVEKAGDHKWLCVEKDEYGKTKYSIYKTYYGNINIHEIYLNIDGIEYELYEKGIATVKNYFGNADVDIYENCEYIDYISKDQKNIISIEKWEDEVEKSQGEYIDSSRITITNQQDIEKVQKEKTKKITSKILVFIICAIVFFPVVHSLFSGLFVNKSIGKYLEKQAKTSSPKYSYVTSITNNTNNKKAKVYKSTLKTIDLVVKDIIDGVPEGITDTVDYDPNTQEDGIGLRTKKEFAYIYKEKGIIYVQISEKEYVSNTSGTTYHSNHYTHYYRTYSSTRESTVYSNYSYSARQNSLNSRFSSGGGTSVGK